MSEKIITMIDEIMSSDKDGFEQGISEWYGDQYGQEPEEVIIEEDSIVVVVDEEECPLSSKQVLAAISYYSDSLV